MRDRRVTRERADFSAYLVVRPEDIGTRTLGELVVPAVKAGFTTVEVRAEGMEARYVLEMLSIVSREIHAYGKAREIALVVHDRIDVALAAQDYKIKVDGVHVGQGDLPAKVCRKLLGEEAIVGISAPVTALTTYLSGADLRGVDYIIASPLHRSAKNPDAHYATSARATKILNMFDLKSATEAVDIPILVGGGVQLRDIASLRVAGAKGIVLGSSALESEALEESLERYVTSWQNS